MALTQKDAELIDAFLSRTLEPEELQAFDERLQRDEALAAHLATALLTRDAILNPDEPGEQPPPAAAAPSPDGAAPASRRGLMLWLGLVLLVVAAFVGWRLLFVEQPELPTPPEPRPAPAEPLAEQTLYRLIDQGRPSLEVMGSGWQTALLNYDFSAAATKLEDELAEVTYLSDRAGAAYYLGLIYLYTVEQRNLDKAITYLQAAVDYRDDVAIHLALAYRRADRPAEARTFFQNRTDLMTVLPDSLARWLEEAAD